MIQIVALGSEQLTRYERIMTGLDHGLQHAQYAALKRAGERGRTEAGRIASERYQISRTGFNQHVTSKIHGLGTDTVKISFAGTVIRLIEYKTRSSMAGVFARVKDGGGNICRAFIDEKLGGGVFERKGASRLPIEQKYGPSTAQMLNDDQVREEMSRTIEEEYEKRMEHEVMRLMNGW